jgi:hypothetical protein
LLFFEIDFDSRKEGGSWNDCLMSIDGTDFRILQKGAMARGNKFASHKYGGKSALRYKLGLDILRGNLVWIEGPYAAGKYPDITIFRNCLKNFLDPNERVVADKGYVGEAPEFVKCPNSTTLRADHREMIRRVSARHETINARLKYWGILAQVYRHDIENHGYVFRAVAVITQLAVENGEPLFDVNYNDID